MKAVDVNKLPHLVHTKGVHLVFLMLLLAKLFVLNASAVVVG